MENKIDRMEEQNRRIHDLSLEEKGLEQTKCPGCKIHLGMLHREIQKVQEMEDAIQDMVEVIDNWILDIKEEKAAEDSEDCLKEVIALIASISLNVSSFAAESSQASIAYSFSVSEITESWGKKIVALHEVYNALKRSLVGERKKGLALSEKYKKMQEVLGEDVVCLKKEVKEERKQREQMRELLEKTEIEKNSLINKISNIISVKEVEAMKSKTMEEMCHYSKELKYRIKDLEKEKEDYLKTSTKEKESDLKKYQELLKSVKIIKEKSILGKGKSFA